MRNPYFLLLLSLLVAFSCSQKTTQNTATDPITVNTPQDEVKSMASKPVTQIMDIPIDDRLTMGVLPNGIKYYIQKNQKPENRAELRLAVNAGSVLEDEDQLGLAHFVEHMAFNGTEHFNKSELVDYLESVGTRFGPDLNAYTSFDETVYMLQVRTDSTELFDQGMLIIRDWANGITFEDEEIDKERGVVVSEWRSRLSPDQRMQQKTFPIMYKGSRYAERLPIGSPDIVENASYETVKRFYKDWYRPDLMAVVVVGDVDVTTIEGQIQKLFGDIAPVETPRPRTKYDVPFHDETLVSIESDKEASFTNVNIMYKHEKIHNKTLDDYRGSLVRSLYNSMLGARLQEISKLPDPPFVFAYTGYSGNVGDLDTYSSFAFVPEGKAEAALETLLTENKRVLKHGFTIGELERAKKNMMESAERNFKEMDKTESRRLVMRYVYKYLDDIATPGPKQQLDLYEKYIPSIQLEEVSQLAGLWIRDNSRVIVITGPEKDETPLPTDEEVFGILDKIDATAVEAYKDEVITEPFFDIELSAVEITKTESFDGVNVDYIKLENGVQVYLKRTDFKNDEILMRATSPGGSSIYNDDDYFDASNAASLVNEAGIGVFSPIQLQKLMAGKNVSVRPYIGSLSEGMNGSSSPDDLEIMFQMIYKSFYEPRIDPEAYTSFITKQKGIYKNLMSNPQYFFSDYVSKFKFDNHARVGWPTEADWAELDYDKAMEIYKDRFGDASDFIFTFVGNYNQELITEYIQKYLGNLPSLNRDETWKDVGIRPKQGEIYDRFNNGEAPKTNVHMYYHGGYEYNDGNNYIMSSMLAYLRIKLRESLREDLGGVYGVGVYGGGSKKPYEKYNITISFNSDPEMTDTLVQAAKEVLKKAIMDGPSEEDMTKVKETQRQSRIKNLKENRFWQGQLIGEHEEGRDFDDILMKDYTKIIDGLTASQIKMAIGKYFDQNNFMQIIMDPDVPDSN